MLKKLNIFPEVFEIVLHAEFCVYVDVREACVSQGIPYIPQSVPFT